MGLKFSEEIIKTYSTFWVRRVDHEDQDDLWYWWPIGPTILGSQAVLCFLCYTYMTYDVTNLLFGPHVWSAMNSDDRETHEVLALLGQTVLFSGPFFLKWVCTWPSIEDTMAIWPLLQKDGTNQWTIGNMALFLNVKGL